jgi:hypothetical protein
MMTARVVGGGAFVLTPMTLMTFETVVGGIAFVPSPDFSDPESRDT